MTKSHGILELARKFIENGGNQDEIIELALDRLDPESLVAVQLMAKDMYDGITFNSEMKWPAATALIAWGGQGIDALVQNARELPTTKNVGMALQILSGVAAHGEEAEFVLSKPTTRSHIYPLVKDWDALRMHARTRLREYVLEFDEDHVDLVGTSMMAMSFTDGLGTVVELVNALSLRFMTIGPQVIGEYELLIETNALDEPAFQSFLEKCPQLIDPLAVEVWAEPDLHGKLSPDFVIRRADNSYLVVEIETPAKLMVTQSDQLSADATHAIQQALGYAEFLRGDLTSAQKSFPGIQNIDALAVVGLERNLSASQKEALRRENASRIGLEVVGFDRLSLRAEAIRNNMITTMTANRGYRMA